MNASDEWSTNRDSTNWEEGRCLFSELGYSILDIRAECELDQVGNYPRELPSDHLSGAIIAHVPIINATTRYDSEQNKKAGSVVVSPLHTPFLFTRPTLFRSFLFESVREAWELREVF